MKLLEWILVRTLVKWICFLLLGAPRILLDAMSSEITVPVEEQFRIKIPFRGTPVPQVTWFNVSPNLFIYMICQVFIDSVPEYLSSGSKQYTAVLCPWRFGGPIRLLCNNAEPFFFCGWSNNLKWASLRSIAHSKRCLFSIPPASEDCSFPLNLGQERL